ncbi:glycosyltransferase [Dictyobacter aurantiacus]|uniref:Glycosyl hydrolase n=1 Tax=Dictyobacter aurantiacus TaxID=1936993 RepID=A0A401ZF57_9CHLR|nr:glycosyltransferase [Dictyobacter aurantiacus]GCE05520.1 glycosyl hydrolase [Dictyobacter aurantiacus]
MIPFEHFIVSIAIPALLSMLLFILLINFSILLINLYTFTLLRVPQDSSMDSEEPLVSVLVPARNEEANIGTCVRSLLAQRYQRLEILVLDDQSSDRTAAIVQGLIDELPLHQNDRLRLLRGGALPPGWIGKNFACQQLAQQARGEYILFTDADTIHQPDMVKAVIGQMRRLGVQLLTAQPAQILGGPGEQLIIPLLNFTIMTLLPVALIYRRPEPSLATGNGQMLCFQRSAYEKIGGHTVVKGRILEDVLLARAIKASGYRMSYVDAQEQTECRMYHSFTEVWSGFSKNLFAFYNYSLVFALGALILNLLLFVAPPIVLIASLLLMASPLIIVLALLATLLPIFMRVLLALRFNRRNLGQALLFSLLHALSIIIECLILLNAIRWHYSKTGTSWKGRYYPA